MRKKSTLQTFAVIVLMCVLFSCSRHRRYHSGNLDVSITDSYQTYKLQAYYDEDKTAMVQRYINRQMEPNGLFESTDDYFDVTTELKDRTRFYIKASPGRLIIKINKRENSYQSYARVKNICEGVAGILKQ